MDITDWLVAWGLFLAMLIGAFILGAIIMNIFKTGKYLYEYARARLKRQIKTRKETTPSDTEVQQQDNKGI